MFDLLQEIIQRKVVIQVLIENAEKILGTFPGVLWERLSVSIDTAVVLGLPLPCRPFAVAMAPPEGAVEGPLWSC